MNGGMDIIVNRIPNAISIPAKALFTRAGKPIVYLAKAGHYRPARSRDAGAQSGRGGHLRHCRRRHGGAGGSATKKDQQEMRARLTVFVAMRWW